MKSFNGKFKAIDIIVTLMALAYFFGFILYGIGNIKQAWKEDMDEWGFNTTDEK